MKIVNYDDAAEELALLLFDGRRDSPRAKEIIKEIISAIDAFEEECIENMRLRGDLATHRSMVLRRNSRESRLFK